MVVFTDPPQKGGKTAANVLTMNETLPEGITLDAHVNAQLKDVMSRGRDFDLEVRTAEEFRGHESVILQFSWTAGGRGLWQKQRYIQRPNNRVTSFVLTCDRDEKKVNSNKFATIEKSFQLKD